MTVMSNTLYAVHMLYMYYTLSYAVHMLYMYYTLSYAVTGRP